MTPNRLSNPPGMLVLIAGIAFVLGFAAASAQTRHAAPQAHAAQPAPPSIDAPPTPYFPSQFELKAGPPGEHIQAF